MNSVVLSKLPEYALYAVYWNIETDEDIAYTNEILRIEKYSVSGFEENYA